MESLRIRSLPTETFFKASYSCDKIELRKAGEDGARVVQSKDMLLSVPAKANSVESSEWYCERTDKGKRE